MDSPLSPLIQKLGQKTASGAPILRARKYMGSECREPGGNNLASSASSSKLRRATESSAGLDLCSTTRVVLTPQMGTQLIDTDFRGPLPKNTVGLLLGGSSSDLRGLIVHPGVIDPDYEGIIKVMVSLP